MELRVHDLQVGVALVRWRAGDARVEDAAEGVDVRPPVERPALDLLWSRVVDRADEESGLGHAARRAALRDPEIGEVGTVLGPDQDVGRLDVAVDEPARVRRVERVRDRREQGDGALGLERAVRLDDAVEIDAVDVAHDDVEPAVLLARVEHLDDARMLDLGGRAPLALEARAEADVVGEVRRQQLDRPRLVEVQVAAAVHRAHAALADHRLDPVTRDDGADHRIRRQQSFLPRFRAPAKRRGQSSSRISSWPPSTTPVGSNPNFS